MEKNILKNFIINYGYQLVLIIVPLILIPYTSRVLLPTNIGIYSYTYSIASFVALFCVPGLNSYGNRSIAKIRNNKKLRNYTFSKIYYFQLINGIIISIIYLFYVHQFAEFTYYFFFMLQSIFVFSTVLDISWAYYGMEEFSLIMLSKSLFKVLSLILILIFVKDSDDLIPYTIILCFTNALPNLVGFFFHKKYFKFTKVSFPDILQSFKPSYLLFLPTIATSIYRLMDKIIIGHYCNISEVGYYSYAEKIVLLSLGSMVALGNVMLPRMAYLRANKDYSTIKKYLTLSMDIAMFWSIGLFFGLFALGKQFAFFFLGPEYLKSGVLLQYISITLIFIAWANIIRNQYIIPFEKDKILVLSVTGGAIINFIFNLIFIPIYGSYGACIGTISAELFVAVYQTVSLRKKLPIKIFFSKTKFFFLFGTIMYISLSILNSYSDIESIPFFIGKVIIGSLIYVCLNMFFYKNDILQILNNRKKRK